MAMLPFFVSGSSRRLPCSERTSPSWYLWASRPSLAMEMWPWHEIHGGLGKAHDSAWVRTQTCKRSSRHKLVDICKSGISCNLASCPWLWLRFAAWTETGNTPIEYQVLLRMDSDFFAASWYWKLPGLILSLPEKGGFFTHLPREFSGETSPVISQFGQTSIIEANDMTPSEIIPSFLPKFQRKHLKLLTDETGSCGFAADLNSQQQCHDENSTIFQFGLRIEDWHKIEKK